MAHRTIYANEDTWQRLTAYARLTQQSVSSVIDTAVTELIDRQVRNSKLPEPICPTCVIQGSLCYRCQDKA